MNRKSLTLIFILVSDLILHPSEGSNLKSRRLKKHYQHRIVGGDTAGRGQAPYLVSIQIQVSVADGSAGWQDSCGGAIICNKVVLTAGHCLIDQDPSIMRIKAGVLNVSEVGQTVSVQTFKVNPRFSYQSDSIRRDIGLIYLSESLTYNKYVSPVRLPRTISVVSGTALLAGWGSIDPLRTDQGYSLMQFAYLPIIEREECLEFMEYTALQISGESVVPICEENICAGPLSGGISACSGDSGGSLVQNNITIGIVSWVIMPCGRPNTTSIFTATSYFVEWIRNNVDDKCNLVYGRIE